MTQFLVYKYIIYKHNACFIAKFINFIEANRLQDDFCKNINFFSFERCTSLVVCVYFSLAFGEPVTIGQYVRAYL